MMTKMTLGITMHSILTFIIKMLCKMTLSIMLFNIMALNIMALNIMALNIMTLSIMSQLTLIITFMSYLGTPFGLSVVMPNVVRPRVMAPILPEVVPFQIFCWIQFFVTIIASRACPIILQTKGVDLCRTGTNPIKNNLTTQNKLVRLSLPSFLNQVKHFNKG